MVRIFEASLFELQDRLGEDVSGQGLHEVLRELVAVERYRARRVSLDLRAA